MRSIPRSSRWAVLGAAAALATAALAVPALAQGTDDAPDDTRADWAGTTSPGERHAEVMTELEGLDGDALAEGLAELRAERQQDRTELRAERHAERQASRAERQAERRASDVEHDAERHAERQTSRAERQAERRASRGERQADGDGAAVGRGPGPRMRADGDCPLASD